ncbi:MAG: hypothetical protein HYR90_04725 [Candidatus Andersenbacteria bacterium]|nr:hypothetical protein [Candidatus Andersenbacteria bacterium]MBI3250425.1 hypothetical protein [Candidatus Andersenbacteria bacterium]
MHIYYFQLGTHFQLSRLEIEKVLLKLKVEATPDMVGQFLRVSTPTELPDTLLSQLGGTERILKHMATFSHQPEPNDILEALAPLPPKWKIGLSVLGASSPLNLQRLGIDIKKAAREQESKVAFIIPAGRSTHLNAAQVIFNRLTKDSNVELFLFPHKDEWVAAKTLHVQDIQAYEKRDTRRPVRDPKAGMLPPKLAQIMINIATGSLPPDSEEITILDPFCGAGTVLQEGWLMRYRMLGSDADTKMIDASEANLRWLADNFSVDTTIPPLLRIHDVQHPFPVDYNGIVSAIVTEPYLGKARSTPLLQQIADRDIKKLIKMYKLFYKNMHSALMPEGLILAALPQIKTSSGWAYFPPEFIDEISRIGYRLQQLSSTPRGTLVYKRPDAVVARELIMFRKA